MRHKRTITDQSGCYRNPGRPVIHACKDPCHRRAVGYRTAALANTHPDYLATHRGNHLYLNLIDSSTPLFYTESFGIALDFLDEHTRSGCPIVIHCNSGLSRAPSLALLWLAKRAHALPAATYAEAADQFRAHMPAYAPGAGIAQFLATHWETL